MKNEEKFASDAELEAREKAGECSRKLKDMCIKKESVEKKISSIEESMKKLESELNIITQRSNVYELDEACSQHGNLSAFGLSDFEVCHKIGDALSVYTRELNDQRQSLAKIQEEINELEGDERTAWEEEQNAHLKLEEIRSKMFETRQA
ncbi:MAG: hypothetical protein EBQ92_00510 [Proteobacteria bacterium]|nr:hypothetical protein [Pseudomonadota bacterium]